MGGATLGQEVFRCGSLALVPISRTSPRSIRWASSGHATGQILQREAEGQQAWIFDLQPVVADRQPDRCAPLGIVAVDHRIDQGLAHGCGRQAPAVGAKHRADGALCQDCLCTKAIASSTGCTGGVDLDPIQDATLVAAGEAPGLDPGIGKKCRSRSWPKRIVPPKVGTVFPWWSATSRRLSRSRRRRLRNGANDSEAAWKSMASELSPGKGCSSKPSPRE